MSQKSNKSKQSKLSVNPVLSVTPVSTTAGSISNGNRVLKWIELGVFASLMIALIILHFTVFTHAGGLWRDEINSLNIATLTSPVDIWGKMQFDSFPILWFLILHAWGYLGFGETDITLRALGLIVGLGSLCTLWLVGRNLSMRLPFISLVYLS